MANSIEVLSTGQVLVKEVAEQTIEVQVPGTLMTVEVSTEGPAGAQGVAGQGIPTGGDPGNVLLKASYSNYEAEWSAVVDGGVFT